MNVRRRPLFVDLRRDGSVNPPEMGQPGRSTTPVPSPTLESDGGQQSHLTRPRAGVPLGTPVQRELGEGIMENGQMGPMKIPPKEKDKVYNFEYRYDDSDTLMNELEEFYPYVEVLLLADSPGRFRKGFPQNWTEAVPADRRAFIEVQLEYLESPRAEIRREAQQSLLYILQGNFGDTRSPEEQLHWIIENAKMVRSVDGLATLVVALKDALRRYNYAAESSGERSNSVSGGTSGSFPVDPYDERSAELMDVLGMLYFIVEALRSDESFGDELMSMSPPLPIVMFQLLASLKDRLPKGFPVKKVLLLIWKVLLACLGGMREVTKAKTLAREMSGLPMGEKDFTKSTPADIASWRRDTSIKFPTFAPPPSSSVSSIPNDRLADTIQPIPVRPNYHSTELPLPSPRHTGPFPGTPAPSPPPSPAKPKKQQYQTDPTKPFLFPYSRPYGAGPSSLVPFAIEEADRLYHRHAYVSLSLYQLWETREECLREERGLGRNGLIGFEDLTVESEDDEDLQWRFEEEERECEDRGDLDGARRAREKVLSAKRLHRVEVIYRSTLPVLQSCVVVLLKLLLATVTSPTTSGSLNYSMSNPAFTSPTQEHPGQEEAVPPPTPGEIDMARHREITSKAVSAILILLLKWFKASNAMKAQYLEQLLFDSNCLLLVLKMFGLSDVFTAVQTKNEIAESNFFRFCQAECSRNRDASPPPPAQIETTVVVTDEKEIYTVTDVSWRNFFSTINFLKILQKMTKHRVHRTFMLSQYKGSQLLKRILRVGHPMMQLQVLKLIKSQMPHCGRKWRQANMKVITSIYLNCRPDLRDEWLAGQDTDMEPLDSHAQEMTLRGLIQFYNKRNYGSFASAPEGHRRTASISHEEGSHEHDVFPPRRTDLMPYNPDGMIEFWLHEYEDVLSEVFGDGEDMDDMRGVAERDGTAWKMLGEMMGEDDISDSESVVSVGELGDEARLDTGQPGENTWEHMSPKTMSLLRSPHERRRSSGSPLRPIMGGAMAGDPFDEGEEDTRGPMPILRTTQDEEEREFGAVDEVEYAYGE